MGNFKLSIVLLAATVFGAVASQQLVAPRIFNGVPADTIKRFPHHVTIRKIYPDYVSWLPCGGSILNERWILTSAFCVDGSDRFELQFERLYFNDTIGSYSAVVNSDAVHIYPTYYDDIAMVKLPFRLQFSDLIKPVKISSQPLSQLVNKFAVLPGFDTYTVYEDTSTSPQLNYAMLNVISNDKCQQFYGSGFDEYQQLCTERYGNSLSEPCITDYGSGLLASWPANSELIGIYSTFSVNCYIPNPAVYTFVAKYASWINSLLQTA